MAERLEIEVIGSSGRPEAQRVDRLSTRSKNGANERFTMLLASERPMRNSIERR